MKLALDEAAKFDPFPNPKVGAVLVKNKKAIYKVAHRESGKKHAEQILIEKFKKLDNYELYITLEPCIEFKGKRTPACSRLLVEAGLKKIYIAMKDPNPNINGKGIKLLKENNIKINLGILEDEAKRINYKYIRFIKKQTPYVALKWAMSMDGKIADKNYNSKYISQYATRLYTRKLRDKFDAVMIGKNTLLKDNPILHTKKYIILIDKDLQLSLNLNIFRHKSKIIIITKNGVLEERVKLYRSHGVKFVFVDDIAGVLSIVDAMKKLRELGINSVLCEGGGITKWHLIKNGLVDEVVCVVSGKIIGGINAPTPVEGEGYNIDKFIKFNIMNIDKIGNDIIINYVHRNY
ncbi:MAG: bifunctional diaminohydroxyphosphoribosylaminopyrimidine deaminase/5-amino-6-(5-phosphoribosylamino)uracil reductase RibD [bacterium]|nr:bifunctional diaminohydroxyphosphoribosylaminopyrimidine deaminase/5-amino-6-(5-phosphoribosylamino)uracil reductase RibD [bacterium]